MRINNRIATAQNADGAFIAPPPPNPAIDRAGFSTFGIVPNRLRGLVALHHDVRNALVTAIAPFIERVTRCKAGDCDCKKGVGDEMAMFKAVELALMDFTVVSETLRGHGLAKSLGGFDIAMAPYVVDGNWGVRAARSSLDETDMARQFLGDFEDDSPFGGIGIDNLFGMADDDVFDLIERSVFGGGAFRDSSPFDALRDLIEPGSKLDGVLGAGSKRRFGARDGLGLGISVHEAKVDIDLRDIVGMDKEQVTAHLRAKLLASKLPSDLVKSMEQSGELDETATKLMNKAKGLGRGTSAARRERAPAHA